ncbi:MAG: hypothetical protein MR280_00030 [Clostridium sp.]|nr:hypothetical protein [Clostridium sp.]
MNTFKLMSRLWSRNKFYKYLILAVIVLFSGFLLYTIIASIREEAPADTLGYAFVTLFPMYLMVIFFLFFSYECFVKINRYKETFSTCKQGISGVYRAQLLLLFSLIGVLTAVACLVIVGYACVAHQVALLPHVLSRVICYQVLCPGAAVFIGLLLSGVRQRYIVYPLMVIFGISETEWLQTTTMHVMETTGKNYAKLMQIFSLLPSSMRYAPNNQIGIPWDLNKIAQLLFFMVFSATVVGLICARTKAKRWWTGGLGLLLSAVLLTGYFMPVSVPVMDLSTSSVFADAAYYETIHAGEQRNVAADFRVKKYRLDFSVGLNLTGSAKVYVDRSELTSYRFTLYHGYKVKQVTDQTGAALDFRREYDYVTVTRGGAAVEYLCLEYTGKSPKYYSSYAGVCLPANFAYYPIPGYRELFKDFYYGFIDCSLPYDTAFDVHCSGRKQMYCNLAARGDNHFAGNARSITLLSGFYDTLKLNNTLVVYPKYADTEIRARIKKNMGTFTKEHRDIRTIFIMDADNLTQYEHLRSYDGYLVTSSIYDMEQSYFESQIDISKLHFYKMFVYYYNEKVDREELERLKQSEDPEKYPMVQIILKLSASKNREAAAAETEQYLTNSKDTRAPMTFLQELGEKYAKA